MKWDGATIESLIYNRDFSQAKCDDMFKRLYALMRVAKPPVQWHKNRLGKQTKTWVGEFRFWIWEGENWRVFVNNTKGTCLEVKLDISKEKVLVAFEDYMTKVGHGK